MSNSKKSPGTKANANSSDEDPPPATIPLGPDGTPFKRKVDADGKPVEGPPRPPLGSDGKPLPPPPIIGSDGKELARPTDKDGKPLPIYVTEKGLPILDKDGKPIPLHFDKDGKPLPLEMTLPEEGSSPPVAAQMPQGRVIEPCVKYLGVVDIVVSVIIAGLTYFNAFGLHSPTETKLNDLSVASGIIALVAAAFGVFPIFAVITDNINALWAWVCTSLFILILDTIVLFFLSGTSKTFALPMVYSLFRFIVAGCVVVVGKTAMRQGGRISSMSYHSRAQVTRVQHTGPQQVIVRRAQPNHQPVIIYDNPYGYGYGGYPHYGSYPYYGEAALMGLAAGSMLSHPYYDYGWGYDGWGYDGFW